MTSRERCRVCGSTAVETHPRLPVERCGNCKEHLPAVDAAREDLAAELARVTAERDQARAIAERAIAYVRYGSAGDYRLLVDAVDGAEETNP